MIVHIAFITLYLISYTILSPQLMNVLLLIHAAIGIYTYIKRGLKLDLLAVYFIYILLSTYGNIEVINQYYDRTLSEFYAYVVPVNFEIATLVWAIGNSFLFLGYELFRKASLPSIAFELKDEVVLKRLFYVMLIMSFRKLVIDDFVIGSFGSLLTAFSTMGILFFARLWGRYDNKVYMRYALILFVVQTCFGVLYGYLRSDMIAPTIVLFIGYFLGRGTIKDLFSYRLVPFIIFFLIFGSYFTFMGNNRDQLSTGFKRLSEIQTIQDYAIPYEQTKHGILERSSIMPQLTSLVELTKSSGYYGGKISSILLTALIPRVLWPEKPVIALGTWFALEIGMATELPNGTINNSINMTSGGQLFLDFGWPGLIIGNFIIGIFLVMLWNATDFHNNMYNTFGMMLGGFLIFTGFQGLGADLQIYITLISYYITFLLLRNILFRVVNIQGR